MDSDTIGPKLIGLTLEQAVRCCDKYGEMFVRPVKINGMAVAVTRDIRADRINVEIENNVITGYRIG